MHIHLQEDFVDQPDIITPPPPPKPHHARTTDDAAETSHPDQRSVLDCVEHGMLYFTVLCALLQRLAVLDADEGARNDDEAGEEDPCAERGE